MSVYAKGGSETKLFLPDEYYRNLDNNLAKAIAARDAEVERVRTTLSKTKQRDITTVVAGVDLRTGEVIVASKSSSLYLQQAVCAEDLVYARFGGNELANIIMTPAVRPFKGVVIKVCPRCQIKFPFNQFMKGTEFQ